ncbi:MAG: helix-turn-helix transcriptional regulator [Alphaproteobacteria bacterium]|nr:MAG: helix-turn-helix transcriptional regulator [Alphaproteobacteria bacterium]
MLDETKHRLISTIYAATLSPQGFNELFVDLGGQLSRLVAEITGGNSVEKRLPHSSDPVFDQSVIADLAEHVRKAHAIQARIGHFDDGGQKTQFIVDCVPNPAIIFDQSERVVATNALAKAQGAPGASTLIGVIGSADELAKIRKAVAGLGKKNEFASVPLMNDPDRGLNSCALIKKIQHASRSDRRADLFLLTIAHFGFDERIRANFRTTYDLTDAEATVAVLLAGGCKPEDIARKRSVSLETVRTQIKSVKHKTNVRDLPHLVRLMCGYSAGILVPNLLAEPDQSALVSGLSASSAMFTLGDGRRLEYIVQGAPAGRPVLLLHNLPYGLVLPEAAIAEATRHGLKIIAPFRPGHGRSDPLPGVAREELLSQVARDLDELLARLAVPSVKLLGNIGGSSYAIRFASMFPHKVSEIVMVSRAPIWRAEWLAGLPPRQKLISMLLRYLPMMANVLVWAILSYVNRQDGGDFLRRSVEDSEADLRALDDPETLRLMVDGIRFGLTQGPEAFCRDWEAMEIDMTGEARALPHKMHIIQGAQDRITRPEFSTAFVEEVPGVTLETVEGAGNLLFYSHWRRVIDRL